MKVKIIEATTASSLETRINNFIIENVNMLKDIKLSEGNYDRYLALIIYH